MSCKECGGTTIHRDRCVTVGCSHFLSLAGYRKDTAKLALELQELAAILLPPTSDESALNREAGVEKLRALPAAIERTVASLLDERDKAIAVLARIKS